MMAASRGGSFSQGVNEGVFSFDFPFVCMEKSFLLDPEKVENFDILGLQVLEGTICIPSYGRHVRAHLWMFLGVERERSIFHRVTWNK